MSGRQVDIGNWGKPGPEIEIGELLTIETVFKSMIVHEIGTGVSVDRKR